MGREVSIDQMAVMFWPRREKKDILVPLLVAGKTV